MENLSAQQSLEIITSMIRMAEGNAKRNSFFFLLWGWVVVIGNLGMYILDKLNYAHPYVIWVITIPAWLFSMYKGYRMGRSQAVVTHLDRITSALWITYGICIFTIVAVGFKINYQLNPLILVITALPTLTSGILLRFKPLIMGGIFFWALGTINFFVLQDLQPLVGALAIIGGYLVPGYMLKKKDNGDV